MSRRLETDRGKEALQFGIAGSPQRITTLLTLLKPYTLRPRRPRPTRHPAVSLLLTVGELRRGIEASLAGARASAPRLAGGRTAGVLRRTGAAGPAARGRAQSGRAIGQGGGRTARLAACGFATAAGALRDQTALELSNAGEQDRQHARRCATMHLPCNTLGQRHERSHFHFPGR